MTEELKALEELHKRYGKQFSINDDRRHGIIKATIKEKEKQDEILQIIKKKRVDIELLLGCGSVDAYNSKYGDKYLTLYEFNLLKEFFK